MKIELLDGSTITTALMPANKAGYVCKEISLDGNDLIELANMDNLQMIATIRQLSGRLERNRVQRPLVSHSSPDPRPDFSICG